MITEPSDPSRPDDTPSRISLQPGSTSIMTSTSNAAASTPHEEKEHLSSLSRNSSPRLTSILLPPSENSTTRPRSSEGRVTSLNLPKHSLHPSRSQRNSVGAPRRRAINNANVGKYNSEGQGDAKASVISDDSLLTFGMGDDLSFQAEDPKVLEDVQRALKAKALRNSSSRSEATVPASEMTPSGVVLSNVTMGETKEKVSTIASPATPPATPSKPVVSIPTRSPLSSASAPPKITFPSYAPSPSRSLESVSSDGRSNRSPVPILVSSHDGMTCLDWSGIPPERDTPEKEKTLFRRTFSITRRKPKDKDRIRGLIGRNSLDFRASEGDLHLATLDSIRRTARRDTLSRAETTKDELGRRYASLSAHKPTGEPALNVLDVIKSRSDGANISTPWLAWCRQLVLSQQKASVWTITADSVDEYLQTSERLFTRPSINDPINASVRAHSPSYGLSSPLSSRRSSFNSTFRSPADSMRKERRRMEPGRSLSANPIVEGVSLTSHSLPPILSRSLSLTQASVSGNFATPSVEQQHSIDVVRDVEPAVSSLTSLSDSPRSSLDRGPGTQPFSIPGKAEGEPIRKKFRLSLSLEKAATTPDSRTSTMSSLTNKLNTTHSLGIPPAGGRLHLGVGNMFGRMRRSGDETTDGANTRSRSSVSDERESGKDGESAKSDDLTGLKETGRYLTTPGLDLRRPRGRDASNTSDSEVGGASSGLLTARIGRRFRRSDKDRDKGRSAEETTGEVVRDSISGGEQWEVDTLATPGWTSKRGIRRVRKSAPREIGREKLQEILRKQEEEEERSKAIYKARELLLVEANDHNRKIARLLKAVCASIREHEDVQSELAHVLGSQHRTIPVDVWDAISADPATTLRHGKGWRAVEDSLHRFNNQQLLLTSYLSVLSTTPGEDISPDLGDSILEAGELWRGLQSKSRQIEEQATTVFSALKRAVAHMKGVQKEFNDTQILVETDYPEQSQITDLEMIITESRAPRGWLEFAAVWIPEHVLEFIGGFIRFFGVPISEKFIRPFLWYFFRDRYYWKIYSTEPPPSERAWYTRLGYWVVILSILAWYTTV